MNYGNAESEIAERINAFILEQGKSNFYEAALMPETEDQFKTFYSNFTKARVAVQYIDSSYNPNNSTGVVSQEEKPKFRLTYETRKLRSEGGLYNLIELTKLALIGWRLSNADRLSVVRYGMLEFEQGAWQPYLEFECSTINVQLHDDFTDPAFGGSLKNVDTLLEFEKPF